MKGRFRAVNMWLHPFFLYLFTFSLQLVTSVRLGASLPQPGCSGRDGRGVPGGIAGGEGPPARHAWSDAGLGGSLPLSAVGERCEMPPKALRQAALEGKHRLEPATNGNGTVWAKGKAD